MDQVKVHVWYAMREFKNSENATETSKNMYSIYCQGVIMQMIMNFC